MLIPPSVLMIVWGVLTEQAIGKLFIAGIIPGFVVVTAYCTYILYVAYTQPHRVGEGVAAHAAGAAALGKPKPAPQDDRNLTEIMISTALVVTLVLGVLGGIWRGWFTPTEGAGVGATASLLLAILKGVRPKEIFQVILTVGRTSAPLLLLLVFAQLYSRVLSMTGVTGAAKALFLNSGLDPWQVLAIMILIWFALGCLIDSISIILLTVPVFAPIAVALGYDPIAFAILGILAIETGLLTPPFGMLVFTVKSALPQENISTGEIFAGAAPYWFCLLVVIVVIAAFPQLATWLPYLGQPGH
jgi:tripartite ATP-independent transporter DctM subunit